MMLCQTKLDRFLVLMILFNLVLSQHAPFYAPLFEWSASLTFKYTTRLIKLLNAQRSSLLVLSITDEEKELCSLRFRHPI